MTRQLLIIALCLLPLPARAEYPVANIPQCLRVENWQGELGEGSCTIATLCTLFNWQGRTVTSRHWRATYSDGQSYLTLTELLDTEGIRYALTFNRADISFLEWAIATRRGCGVSVSIDDQADHMVTLVHLDEREAIIIDNRRPPQLIHMQRNEFLKEWIDSYSWALTPVYTPLPPVNEDKR